MIEVIPIEEALGLPLAHDITEIRPGEFKGPAFLKGQVLKGEDLEHLRRLGKNHLYVLKLRHGQLHEDEAAIRIAEALCGPGVGWDQPPREGKISLKARRDGLLKVDTDALMRFNLAGDVMCASMHSNTVVTRGRQVGATRAIPLVVGKAAVKRAIAAARRSPEGVLRVLPIKKAKAGLMITGNEVYDGRIEDKFEPVLRRKIAELGGDVIDVVILPDDDRRIADAAIQLVSAGANIVISTGGMSVDPDDRTRHAMRLAGVRDMVYGSPVLPGAMFMIGFLGKTPVLATPACGMYAARTIMDLVLPRVLAGEKITRTEIAMLGHGGLCLKCSPCVFPHCPFGKV